MALPWGYWGGPCRRRRGPDGSPKDVFSYRYYDPVGAYSVRWTVRDPGPSDPAAVAVADLHRFGCNSGRTGRVDSEAARQSPDDPDISNDFYHRWSQMCLTAGASRLFVDCLCRPTKMNLLNTHPPRWNYFPNQKVMSAVIDAIEERQPGRAAPRLYLRRSTRRRDAADEDRIVRAAVRYLSVPDWGHQTPTPHPYVLSTTGAAIKLLTMVSILRTMHGDEQQFDRLGRRRCFMPRQPSWKMQTNTRRLS